MPPPRHPGTSSMRTTSKSFSRKEVEDHYRKFLSAASRCVLVAKEKPWCCVLSSSDSNHLKISCTQVTNAPGFSDQQNIVSVICPFRNHKMATEFAKDMSETMCNSRGTSSKCSKIAALARKYGLTAFLNFKQLFGSEYEYLSVPMSTDDSSNDDKNIIVFEWEPGHQKHFDLTNDRVNLWKRGVLPLRIDYTGKRGFFPNKMQVNGIWTTRAKKSNICIAMYQFSEFRVIAERICGFVHLYYDEIPMST